jgi:hypothetical protein
MHQIVAAACTLMTVCAVTDLPAEIRHYRYSLSTRAGEPLYAGEITDRSRPPDYYTVECDAPGRIVKEITVTNGRPTGFDVNIYVGDQKRYDSYENYDSTGTKTGFVRVKRDAEGKKTRLDCFTVAGVLTSYQTYDYSPDQVDSHDYNSDGVETERAAEFFDAAGILVKKKIFVSSSRFTEIEFSPTTGLAQSRRQFLNGALTVRSEFVYNANGQLTKMDGYKPNGTPLASIFYEDGLATKRAYYFDDGTVSREISYTFGERRELTAAKITYRGNFVCSLSYDRLEDGTIRKTVANGPDGTVWAEYPDHEVKDINADGQPVGTTSAHILKSGPWFGN